MEAVNELSKVSSHTQIILILILCLVAAVFVLENFNRFKKLIGIKTVHELNEENQEERIGSLKKEVDDIKEEIDDIREYEKDATKKRKEFESNVTSTLSEIKDEMFETRVSNIKRELLDFANAITKREYNKECYDHILEQADLYHELLNSRGLENGKTNLAVDYIKRRYSEYLEKGFPEY